MGQHITVVFVIRALMTSVSLLFSKLLVGRLVLKLGAKLVLVQTHTELLVASKTMTDVFVLTTLASCQFCCIVLANHLTFSAMLCELLTEQVRPCRWAK